MSTFRRILVPVDFTPISFSALDCAILLAKGFCGTVDALHVWQPELHPALDAVAIPSGVGPFVTFANSDAGREMRELIDTRYAPGVDIRGRIEVGEPTAVIVAAAADYDLIVLGMRKRAGLFSALLGGLAAKLVRKAPCPVLTVRESDPPIFVPGSPRDSSINLTP